MLFLSKLHFYKSSFFSSKSTLAFLLYKCTLKHIHHCDFSELLRSVLLIFLPLCCNPALPTKNRMWARNASTYVIYSFLVTAFRKKNKWNLFYYYISHISVSKIAFQQVTNKRIIELYCILSSVSKSLKRRVHHALRGHLTPATHGQWLRQTCRKLWTPSQKKFSPAHVPHKLSGDSWTPGSYLALPVIK